MVLCGVPCFHGDLSQSTNQAGDLLHRGFAVTVGVVNSTLRVVCILAGCLFYYHVLHRPMLDQHIHSLLLITIFSGACSTMLEVFLRDNIVLEMFRACVTIVQGTWFWQVSSALSCRAEHQCRRAVGGRGEEAVHHVSIACLRRIILPGSLHK